MTVLTESATDTLHSLALSGDLAQLAASGSKGYPTGENYVAEPKWDGWRIIAHVREDDVALYSRSGKSYNGKLPKVEAELLAHFPAGTWLDGEAVAIRVEGGIVFNDWKVAQSVLSKVGADAAADRISYMVFDLIAHRDIDARTLPLIDRRGLLEQIFEDEDFSATMLSPITEATEENIAAYIAAGYEGAVVKRLDKPYGAGKREGGGWTKVKPKITIDTVIMGFKPGENGFKGLIGAVIFGQHDPDTGKLVERGKCSGMDMRTRQDMSANPEKYIGKVLEVKLVSTMGGAGNPPQFGRMRVDRKPESVVTHDA